MAAKRNQTSKAAQVRPAEGKNASRGASGFRWKRIILISALLALLWQIARPAPGLKWRSALMATFLGFTSFLSRVQLDAEAVYTAEAAVQTRKAYVAASKMFSLESHGPYTITDQVLAGVPCRIYTPDTPATAAGGSESTGNPIVMYFHGGGFVVGTPPAYDTFIMEIMDEMPMGLKPLVVSVDYRLAPESPFPVGSDDCVRVTKWVIENAPTLGGDPARIAVAGDSAGGNLATVTLLKMRQQHPDLASSIVGQLLLCPAIDLTLSSHSMTKYHSGYFLTLRRMRWFVSLYLADPADAFDPFASPVFSPNATLVGMPPTHIIVAECDPLHDEGPWYQRRLLEADPSNDVSLTDYPGTFHDFFMFPVEGAQECRVEAAAFFTRLFK